MPALLETTEVLFLVERVRRTDVHSTTQKSPPVKTGGGTGRLLGDANEWNGVSANDSALMSIILLLKQAF